MLIRPTQVIQRAKRWTGSRRIISLASVAAAELARLRHRLAWEAPVNVQAAAAVAGAHLQTAMHPARVARAGTVWLC